MKQNLLDQFCCDTATVMLSFLDIKSLYHISLVSKRWNEIIESEQVAPIWISLFDWYTLGPVAKQPPSTDWKKLLQPLVEASSTGIDLKKFAGRHLCFGAKTDHSAMLKLEITKRSTDQTSCCTAPGRTEDRVGIEFYVYESGKQLDLRVYSSSGLVRRLGIEASRVKFSLKNSKEEQTEMRVVSATDVRSRVNLDKCEEWTDDISPLLNYTLTSRMTSTTYIPPSYTPSSPVYSPTSTLYSSSSARYTPVFQYLTIHVTE